MKNSDKLLIGIVSFVIILMILTFLNILDASKTASMPKFELEHQLEFKDFFKDEIDSLIINSEKSVKITQGNTPIFFYSNSTKPIVSKKGKKVIINGLDNYLNLIVSGSIKYIETECDSTNIYRFKQDSLKIVSRNTMLNMKDFAMNFVSLKAENSRFSFDKVKINNFQISLSNKSSSGGIAIIDLEVDSITAYVDHSSFLPHIEAKRINFTSEKRKYSLELN